MSLKSYFRHDDGRLNPLGFIVLGVLLAGVLSMVPMILFGIYFIYDMRVNAPKAAQIQTQLENEFRAIQPPLNATSVDYDASHKTQHALVSNTYRTALSYPEIREHYEQQLTKSGWSFYEEERMTDWGTDLGGKTARYCKGEYRADLQYAGERANYGWEYAFSVSWGLDAINEQYPEAFYKAGCK